MSSTNFGSLPLARHSFTTSDGPDVDWHVERFRYTEQLSVPFALDVELSTTTLEVDAETLLGSKCELTIERDPLLRIQAVDAIVQIGTPQQIVANPVNEYVREFTRDVPRAKVLTATEVMQPNSTDLTINQVPQTMTSIHSSG